MPQAPELAELVMSATVCGNHPQAGCSWIPIDAVGGEDSTTCVRKRKRRQEIEAASRKRPFRDGKGSVISPPVMVVGLHLADAGSCRFKKFRSRESGCVDGGRRKVLEWLRNVSGLASNDLHTSQKISPDSTSFHPVTGDTSFQTLLDNRPERSNGSVHKAESRIHSEESHALDLQGALIADDDGDRAIHIAVVHEDVRLVRKLCSLMRTVCASVDSTNILHQTPLHLAVIIGHENLTQVLLEEGASVILRDRYGNTPLHLAVKYFSSVCLDVLLKSNLTREIFDWKNYEGYSALHLAVFANNHQAIHLLVSAGCDINIQDGKSGRTPLFHAVMSDNKSLAKLLLHLQARIDVADYGGVTPLAAATECGLETLVHLLDSDAYRVKSRQPTPS